MTTYTKVLELRKAGWKVFRTPVGNRALVRPPKKLQAVPRTRLLATRRLKDLT
jgi:hypothetical protein